MPITDQPTVATYIRVSVSPTALNVAVVKPLAVVGVNTQLPEPLTTVKIFTCPTVPLAKEDASDPEDKAYSVVCLVRSAVEVPVAD